MLGDLFLCGDVAILHTNGCIDDIVGAIVYFSLLLSALASSYGTKDIDGRRGNATEMVGTHVEKIVDTA